LVILTKDWRRSLDKKEIAAVISMALLMAFDTIPHALLLAKLKTYVVNSNSCTLLADYLKSKMQGVKVGEEWRELHVVRLAAVNFHLLSQRGKTTKCIIMISEVDFEVKLYIPLNRTSLNKE